jgi:hypothetical protein
MSPRRPVWRAIEWERAWKLYESTEFTNGEKVVIAWMVSNARYLDVKHAHQFIANGTRVSRSTVTRTMRKLVTMEAASQEGEMRIQLRHPRRTDASSMTHNGNENVAKPAPYQAQNRDETTGQRMRRIASENKAKYGDDWKDFAFCRGCLEASIPLRFLRDKYNEQLKRTLPVYECKSCADDHSRDDVLPARPESSLRCGSGSGVYARCLRHHQYAIVREDGVCDTCRRAQRSEHLRSTGNTSSRADLPPRAIRVIPLRNVIQARITGSYKEQCPVCRERKRTLSVAVKGDGKVLLHCFSGCATKAVLDALGLRWSDLRPRKA